ncbi:hypothetical protein DLAC_04142 [Tieghemostelium lacteum]|uniref:Uncharacterized protein n=1 Tax=Tieghemostelium lacteum TaxID=361077 RepID=A0A151ZS82_TIELA|nr:hypothetical protein DLAC_04142 [Tieghemostelium lacteum]|eukprot:KYQ96837.1 hypothetical protein DLAC_04142 [Tieghemostelium lacteum]
MNMDLDIKLERLKLKIANCENEQLNIVTNHNIKVLKLQRKIDHLKSKLEKSNHIDTEKQSEDAKVEQDTVGETIEYPNLNEPVNIKLVKKECKSKIRQEKLKEKMEKKSVYLKEKMERRDTKLQRKHDRVGQKMETVEQKISSEKGSNNNNNNNAVDSPVQESVRELMLKKKYVKLRNKQDRIDSRMSSKELKDMKVHNHHHQNCRKSKEASLDTVTLEEPKISVV